MKKAVIVGKEINVSIASANGMRRELLRLPDSNQPNRSDQYVSRDNDDFIASESDRQMLLIKYVLVFIILSCSSLLGQQEICF